MINKSVFYIVTTDIMTISSFSFYKKEGVQIEYFKDIVSLIHKLKSEMSFNFTLLLIDISEDSNNIFKTVTEILDFFPSKQILFFTNIVELEHIRIAKELAISSVITQKDCRHLFELSMSQHS